MYNGINSWMINNSSIGWLLTGMFIGYVISDIIKYTRKWNYE